MVAPDLLNLPRLPKPLEAEHLAAAKMHLVLEALTRDVVTLNKVPSLLQATT